MLLVLSSLLLPFCLDRFVNVFGALPVGAVWDPAPRRRRGSFSPLKELQKVFNLAPSVVSATIRSRISLSWEGAAGNDKADPWVTTSAVDFREEDLEVRDNEPRDDVSPGNLLLIAEAKVFSLEENLSEAGPLALCWRLLPAACSRLILLLGAELLRKPAEIVVDCFRFRVVVDICVVVVDSLGSGGGALGASCAVAAAGGFPCVSSRD